MVRDTAMITMGSA